MDNPPRSLDGLTLFRFVHAFDSAGGMERLIEDMDRALLERNAMTVVRMHFAREASSARRSIQELGRGRLIRVPMPCRPGLEEQYADEPIVRFDWRMALRRHVLNHPLAWRLLVGPWVRRRRLAPRTGEMIGAGAAFARLANEFSFDLCVMHFFGSADADEVIKEARRRRLPIALSNHFANDRFLHLAIRQHTLFATRIGSMNGLQVPAYLSDRFANLADGIDLDFFDPSLARCLSDCPGKPILFLPARVLRSKGHWDVIGCARRLHDQGLPVTVVFAGRTDSEAFVAELHREIERLGLTNHVRFLGPQPPAVLRDWYHASAVTVFPTYHHEGLGRIVIESQAMGTPPVAYATGGVADGIRDGETGFLVPTGKVATLTERVARLLRDRPLRDRMACAGRAFVEGKYSLAAFAGRHEEFYRSCLRA
jgi:glycosyltransferase involved in cell wall biosynthesis